MAIKKKLLKTVIFALLLFSLCFSAYQRPTQTQPNIVSVELPIPEQKPTEIKQSDLIWLTRTIYFEARGEPILAQRAVGFVVLNRVYDYRFPNTIPSVVKQKGQFVWTKHKKNLKYLGDGDEETWQACMTVAKNVLSHTVPNPVKNAKYFHVSKIHSKHKIGHQVFLASLENKGTD